MAKALRRIVLTEWKPLRPVTRRIDVPFALRHAVAIRLTLTHNRECCEVRYAVDWPNAPVDYYAVFRPKVQPHG